MPWHLLFSRARYPRRSENRFGSRTMNPTAFPGWLWMGFYYGLAMFWETLWALVLGFGISAALQVFVSKEQMTRAFGRDGLREVALATGFGAASSSCSYAAVAAAKTAFKKGA